MFTLSQEFIKSNKYDLYFDNLPDIIVSNFLAGNISSLSAVLVRWTNNIAINKSWYKVLVNNDCKYKELKYDAFICTIAHELTHIKYLDVKRELYNNYNISRSSLICSNNKKFIKWIDEIKADFGIYNYCKNYISLEQIRIKLVNSILFKMLYQKKIKSYNTHPSWTLRLYYAQSYYFNEELIDVIACECKCNNFKLINAIKDIYLE